MRHLCFFFFLFIHLCTHLLVCLLVSGVNDSMLEVGGWRLF